MKVSVPKSLQELTPSDSLLFSSFKWRVVLVAFLFVVIALNSLHTASVDSANHLTGKVIVGKKKPRDERLEPIPKHLEAPGMLAAGDLVIISLKADDPDSFRFVPLVNLAEGSEIIFTDSGWYETSNQFRGHEGAVKYTVPAGGITAGSNIEFTGIGTNNFSAANNAVVGNSGFAVALGGDQLLAFQGSSSSPTFLFGVQSNSTEWQTGDPNSSQQSAVPTGLTDGTNAVAHGSGSGPGDEFDNIWYTGITSGTPAELLAAVANDSNWTGSNSNYSPITTDFTIIATVIELSSFTAHVMDGMVEVTWQTAAEIDNAGFHLHRATSPDGPYIQINKALIPATGSPERGERYSYLDRPREGPFFYKLEDVDIYGTSNWHGPVSVEITPELNHQLFLPTLLR